MNEREILGVTIDSKLTWTKHVSNTASRAGQKLGALRRVANKLNGRGRARIEKGPSEECNGIHITFMDGCQPENTWIPGLDPEEGN